MSTDDDTGSYAFTVHTDKSCIIKTQLNSFGMREGLVDWEGLFGAESEILPQYLE